MTIPRRGQWFVITAIDTFSGYGYKFAFPDHHASANSTICGLIKIFCHNYGIPHNISFHQGTCFTAKEVRGL